MERLTRRVSFSNVLAVIVALYIGVHCSGCGPVQFRQLSIPEAEPFVDDSLTLLIGARDLTPTMFHASVWRMVETCLGHPPGNMLVRPAPKRMA